MKPRAHRVCTFSRLFSDFQNSLALRNTTESSLTEGRSCFALRLIGQGTEMSVFFPHLSKAEHVRQTKKYPGNPCFPRFPAPCEAEHRRQPGRPYFGTFDHTGADSVSRLHLGKGRKRSPDVFCCPESLLYGRGYFYFQHASRIPGKIKESQISLALQVYVRKHIPQFMFRLYHLHSSFSRPFIRFFNKILQDRHSHH